MDNHLGGPLWPRSTSRSLEPVDSVDPDPYLRFTSFKISRAAL